MDTLLARLSDALPARARPYATPARLELLGQFIRFGVVGTLCFGVDTATVYALRDALGLYGAGVASYVVAASVGWGLNRRWTFRHRGGAPHRQWALFMTAGLIGFTFNRGAYVALATTSPFCAARPVTLTAAGAIAGMFVNFATSRAVVFR